MFSSDLLEIENLFFISKYILYNLSIASFINHHTYFPPFFLLQLCQSQLHQGSCCMVEGEFFSSYLVLVGVPCLSLEFYQCTFSWWIDIANAYRLFFMLRRFPIESKGRRKKLHEVCAFPLKFVQWIMIASFVTVKFSLFMDIYWVN